MDKAGKPYWDKLWEETTVPDVGSYSESGRVPYIEQCMRKLFRYIFSVAGAKNGKLLELGCAKSTWLPYFAKEFSFDIYGIDYSRIGCEQEKQILEKAGVKGNIVCADFFTPPEELLNQFNIVYSGGVAEHFQDTSACISAFSAFLQPEGVMITLVPNIAGIYGSIQKVINRPVYDIHVPLSANQLQAAHEKVGLEILFCDYFFNVNFGLLNLSGLDERQLITRLKKILISFLSAISVLVWRLAEKGVNFPASAWFSPYIVCVAKKVF